MAKTKKNKKGTTVMLEVDQITWLDKRVKKGTFESRSHGVRKAIEKLMKEEV